MRAFKGLLLAIILSLFSIPSFTYAAILYLDPPEGKYHLGDEFTVDIKLDVTEYCINTVEATIDFSNDIAQLVDFSTGNSMLDIWVAYPTTAQIPEINSEGELYIAGGIPGGYCGRIPGDPGESNVIGTLVFKVPSFSVSNTEDDTIRIGFLDNTRALINDGLGTTDDLITKPAVFSFTSEPALKQEDWQSILRQDTFPPEPFVVELQQNPAMFDGQYYVIFSTTDKQSGLDHFEILEIKPGEQIGVMPSRNYIDLLLNRKLPPPEWKIANIPYLLSDQSLKSIIRVRAIDKAGNERVVEYIPPTSMQVATRPAVFPIYATIVAVVLVILIFIIILIRIIQRRKNEKKDF
jgi:hypothetical protein